MKGYIYWDKQDPQDTGWVVAYLGEDSPLWLDADDAGDPGEAKQEAADILGCEAADIGQANDDREAAECYRELEATT